MSVSEPTGGVAPSAASTLVEDLVPELLVIIGLPCAIALMAVAFVLTVSVLGEVPPVVDARAAATARADARSHQR